VAGYALPTRSVRPLPHTPPAREPAARPIGRARAARSAFSFASAFALMTFAAAGLAWLSEQPRFELQVPEGTAGLFESITTVTAVASVVTLGIGLAALVVWCVRATAAFLRASAHRRTCA
jgi:hypothetical protein